MGQSEVLKIMKSFENEWVTTKKVNEKTKCTRGNTTRSLRKLMKQGYLERKPEEEIHGRFSENQGRGFGQWVWKLKKEVKNGRNN